MNQELYNRIKSGISIVIDLLEENYRNNPLPMVELILKRYTDAGQLLDNNDESLRRVQYLIKGSTRAYLEAASDYMNPMLMQMDNVDKLLVQILDSK